MTKNMDRAIGAALAVALVVLVIVIGFKDREYGNNFRDDQIACLDSGGIPVIIDNTVAKCWMRETP